MSTPAPTVLVRIRNLTFGYSGSHDVLRIPALDITGRGLIAITGPSGAGKSTLVELLAGTLREPYGGSLQVLGQEWRSLNGDAERQRHLRRIGLIPQDYGLLTNRTPRQMLEQDLADAEIPLSQRSGRIDDALKQVGMIELANRQIGQLSGGQRQRVAIARMLARDVELVIADEPTANLDRELTWQTLGILRQLSRKAPVLVITHEPEVAEACDRTIVLQALATPEIGLPPPSAPQQHTRRNALAAAVAAIVLVGAGVGAWALAGQHKRSPNEVAATSTATSPRTSASTTSPTPSPSSTPSETSPAKLPVTTTMLITAGACANPCTITGKVPYDDPVGGASTLVTALSSANGQAPGNGYIAAVSSDGQVTWRYQLPGSTWFTLAPAPRPIDSTGHIFINYNPGRYNGVIILDPTGDGFDDYRTLPGVQAESTGRFYSAVAVDPTHSGIYEIQQTANNCVPDCADGTQVQSFWRWNGTDYSLQ